MASFFFHIISITAAFYGIFKIMQFLGAPTPLAVLLSIALLVGLELMKRESSDHVWDIRWSRSQFDWSWVTLSLFLFLTSAAISGFGIYQGTKDFAPQAALITGDSTLTLLEQQLAVANEGSQQMQANKNHEGVVFWHSQRAVTEFAKAQNAAITSIVHRSNQIDQENEQRLEQQAVTVAQAALVALIICLMLELLFETCMSFCSLYDFRDYLESEGLTPELFHSEEFQTSTQFRNLMENLPKHNHYNSVEVGFSAIKNRVGKTPPLSGGEKRGGTEYTQFHSSTDVAEKRAEKKKIRIVTQVEEDAERAVVELCGKIQRFYPSRWKKVAARNGKLSTMATNFHTFLTEIDEILKENPKLKLPLKWKKRVVDYRDIFNNQIHKHL